MPQIDCGADLVRSADEQMATFMDNILTKSSIVAEVSFTSRSTIISDLAETPHEENTCDEEALSDQDIIVDQDVKKIFKK